jgi:hypothetical protein
MTVAARAGLAVDDAVVLNNSNRLVALLLPCRSVARVSPTGWFSATLEVDVARRLASIGDVPVAGLDPRVEPEAITRDGFEIALWTYLEPLTPVPQLASHEYAHALERLHHAMRRVDTAAPHVTDRVAEIRQWLADIDITPDLSDRDRTLLDQRLEFPSSRPAAFGGDQQLLHGEPHPWNVLPTETGPLFIDLENCAQGPVEYDLAWVPRAVSEHYPNVDQKLVDEHRRVVLALVAVHRWRHDDQHPSGRASGRAFLDVLRSGPPWPALDDIHW